MLYYSAFELFLSIVLLIVYPLVTIYLLLATLWALLLVQVLPQTTFGDDLAATGLLGDHFEIPGIHASYDYIIVGGGTAGITLARRLAANTSVTVALIEAGGFYESDNCNRSQIPADAVSWLEAEPVSRNPLIDWYQFTTPQDVKHVHISFR